MKVAPRDLGRFLKTAEASVAAVLFYGPDQGLVRERAIELITRLAGDVRDPFRVAELTPAQLKEDPVRLADEAAALSLTGGRRVLRLREAGDGLTQALSELLAETTPAAFLVLEAGELGPRSSLRGLFERADLRRAVRARHPAADPRGVAATRAHSAAVGRMAGGGRDTGVRPTRRAGAGQLWVGDVQRERRRPGERGGRRATRQLGALVHLAIARRRHPDSAAQVVAQVAARAEAGLPGHLIDGEIARLQ